MVDETTRLNDLQLLNSLPRMNESVVKKHYPFIINHINDFLNPEIHSYSFKHKLCYYFNNLKTFPKCKICGQENKREIYLFPAGFNDANLYTCCKKCALIYGSEKAKKTSLKKYGVTNISLLKEIQEKKNKTCLEHYGVTNPSKSKEICDKRVKTILERYGTTNVNELPEIKQKIKDTCLKRYGVESVMCCQEIVEKLKRTNLERFGSEWYLGTDDCLEKTKRTVIEKYGVDHINKTLLSKQNHKVIISKYWSDLSQDNKILFIIKKFESNKKLNESNLYCYRNYKRLCMYKKVVKNIEISKRLDILIKQHSKKLIQIYGTTELSENKIKEINYLIGVKKAQRKYLYNKIQFDSKPELALYIYLSENNIPFKYHPEQYIPYTYNGEIKKYFPDFLINNQYIEIKGDHFFREDGRMYNPFSDNEIENEIMECKHQCMLKNNVKILRNKDYLKYLNYIENKYGSKYLDNFRNNKNEDITTI